MKKLYIVGAGGFGRELHSWIQQHPDFNSVWKIAGFLDDNPNALKLFGSFAKVLPLKGHKVSVDNLYLCGLGLPAVKKELLTPLVKVGAEFITFIHPTCVIGERVKIGRGVVLCPGISISVDITIGDFSMIGPNTTIGHDVSIGEWNTLCAQCDITGHVVVGDSVFMGSRVSVIPSKKLGNKSIVGAGAVVISNVPEGCTVAGNPARLI
jgi:sugar O-acyltransferase (sialic acid O-acetyltransferase NeuD family)